MANYLVETVYTCAECGEQVTGNNPVHYCVKRPSSTGADVSVNDYGDVLDPTYNWRPRGVLNSKGGIIGG